jgi:hypothetical protein
VRKFRVLLDETTLYRIDLRPLFLRHARHHRQRTGFSLGNNWILAPARVGGPRAGRQAIVLELSWARSPEL